MDFKDMQFSKLFLDKHGKNIFKEITTIIEYEKLEKFGADYIELIFKVAFMSCFGLDNNALNQMLKDINCDIDIKEIKKIHRNSIKTIQKFIKQINSESI